VKALVPEFGVSACCRVLEVPRSTVCYKRKERLEVDLSRLKLVIQALLVTWRGYGVQRMFVHLRGMGVATSRREVRRAYAELGLLKKPHRRRVSTTNSRHSESIYPNLVKGLEIQAPDHVWAADVTYFRVRSRYGYLALLMDIYTREIVGWQVAFANDTSLTLAALREALRSGRRPRLHHSDQGSNYAAKLYVLELQIAGVKISMTEVGRPQDNGFAERLNRTVKEEEILHCEYQNLEEARQGIAAYVRRYNEERIHSSLGYRKPAQAFREWVQSRQGGPP
jgi:putative transposase